MTDFARALIEQFDGDPLEGGARLRLQPAEKSGQPPEAFLAPLRGRVVVALRALDLVAEKDARHPGREFDGGFLRIKMFQDVVGRRLFLVVPPVGDQVGEEPVVRHVGPERVLEPADKGGEMDLDGVGLGEAVLEENAEPLVGPELGG